MRRLWSLAVIFAVNDPIQAMVAIMGALSGLAGIVLGFFVYQQNRHKDTQAALVAQQATHIEERSLGAELMDSLLGRQGEWIDKQAKTIQEQTAEIRGLRDDLDMRETELDHIRAEHIRERTLVARYRLTYGDLDEQS